MTSDEVIESYFRHGTGQNSGFVLGHNEFVAIPVQEADDMPHSTLYRAKRALASVLLRLAAACGLQGSDRGQHDMLNTQAHPTRHDTASGNTTRLGST